MRILLNILWFIFGGFISFLEMVAVGMFCCVTLIGIPWGLQCFKIAGLAACPFGKEVEYEVGLRRYLRQHHMDSPFRMGDRTYKSCPGTYTLHHHRWYPVWKTVFQARCSYILSFRR